MLQKESSISKINFKNLLSKGVNINVEKLKGSQFDNIDSDFHVARFDHLHPVVSGNKFYKLHEFIEQAKKEKINIIVTAGGAFSNHLVATAYLTKQLGIKSFGLVRGEWKATNISPTLSFCASHQMTLIPVKRDDYAKLDEHLISQFTQLPANSFLFIPEGGFHPLGAEGATWMMRAIEQHNPTHIILATGTCTTIAGMMKAATPQTTIIGIPVLKGIEDELTRINQLIGETWQHPPVFFKDYHWGGYARFNSSLLDFMNSFYDQTSIPTDFVYTAKMFYALQDLAQKKYFPTGSNVIAIHTGGLQGNFSLPKGRLNF